MVTSGIANGFAVPGKTWLNYRWNSRRAPDVPYTSVPCFRFFPRECFDKRLKACDPNDQLRVDSDRHFSPALSTHWHKKRKGIGMNVLFMKSIVQRENVHIQLIQTCCFCCRCE
ncbi:uncharacterized protein LOC120253003 [Dioscorea cayenensis subsp. rotundata]|uniref:Uncharacterized protein LOC120253003 n=1 Tax=Dioscorea cayennensis subsp. rotundata TaxID=55577 RepID=A0AB40AQV5_DIOCR|nr:uncharacterized protein LOC120253003 [Dioscorea cayenensis subsp. rotundata]